VDTGRRVAVCRVVTGYATADRVVSNGRGELLIYSDVLQEELARWWAEGLRRCVLSLRLVVPVDEVDVEAALVRRGSRFYFRPLGEARQMLRRYHQLYKGQRERLPLPVLIERVVFYGKA